MTYSIQATMIKLFSLNIWEIAKKMSNPTYPNLLTSKEMATFAVPKA